MRPSTYHGLAAVLQILLWSTHIILGAGFRSITPGFGIRSPFTPLLPLWAATTGTTTEYSAATLARIEGLDAVEERHKLSEKLKISKEKLQNALQNQLATMADPTTEKAEYVAWLLSSYTDSTIPKHRVVHNADKTKMKIKKKSKPSSYPLPSISSTGTVSTFSTNIRFSDLDYLHPQTKRAIDQVLGLDVLTEIQAKTFQTALSGQDLLGRARTGSGKTMAFLMIATQSVLQLPPQKSGISILILSPTRELASQIASQAEQLMTFHPDFSVQVMFGGNNKNADTQRLNRRTPSMLVATPGRLLDHLQSTRLNDGRPFGNLLSTTSVLVLDETDRLLDMGFRREIQKIVKFLPSNQHRQTLLFSATIPKELKAIMAQTMKPDFVEVDCIQDGEPTVAKIKQSYVVVPQERLASSVVEIVTDTVRQDPKAKIVVFFPTARLVNFYAEAFNCGNILPVMELHSKKSQSYRNRVSNEFRNANTGILFTSDVSARGVDYPNVSHVLQFGIPDTREQYIHRLGRTGRADADGQGCLVLADFEATFLKELKGVDITIHKELQELIRNPATLDSQALLKEIRRQVRGGHAVLSKAAMGAYQASLGYYLGQMKRIDMKQKEDLVEFAHDFALQLGLYEPPPLTSQMVGKMGLKGVKGLSVVAKSPKPNNKIRNGRSNKAREDSGIEEQF
jgi:ATP-dependent RNA helicase MSS116, mitochondrial